MKDKDKKKSIEENYKDKMRQELAVQYDDYCRDEEIKKANKKFEKALDNNIRELLS